VRGCEEVGASGGRCEGMQWAVKGYEGVGGGAREAGGGGGEVDGGGDGVGDVGE